MKKKQPKRPQVGAYVEISSPTFRSGRRTRLNIEGVQSNATFYLDRRVDSNVLSNGAVWLRGQDVRFFMPDENHGYVYFDPNDILEIPQEYRWEKSDINLVSEYFPSPYRYKLVNVELVDIDQDKLIGTRVHVKVKLRVTIQSFEGNIETIERWTWTEIPQEKIQVEESEFSETIKASAYARKSPEQKYADVESWRSKMDRRFMEAYEFVTAPMFNKFEIRRVKQVKYRYNTDTILFRGHEITVTPISGELVKETEEFTSAPKRAVSLPISYTELQHAIQTENVVFGIENRPYVSLNTQMGKRELCIPYMNDHVSFKYHVVYLNENDDRLEKVKKYTVRLSENIYMMKDGTKLFTNLRKPEFAIVPVTIIFIGAYRTEMIEKEICAGDVRRKYRATDPVLDNGTNFRSAGIDLLTGEFNRDGCLTILGKPFGGEGINRIRKEAIAIAIANELDLDNPEPIFQAFNAKH